jgi:3-hydroxyacyl-CoA dehydrogenase
LYSASLANYTFVGTSLGPHYKKVDFVQEVRTHRSPLHTIHTDTKTQNAPERQDLKQSLLAEIDSSVRSDVVIASSSSGIPSSQFTSKCKFPERVLIGHPFNPPHLMPLVEVVPHPGTSSIALETAMAFYKSLGRRPIHVKKEVPGFVANRLQAALCNEAYGLVSRGVVGAEDLGTSPHSLAPCIVTDETQMPA